MKFTLNWGNCNSMRFLQGFWSFEESNTKPKQLGKPHVPPAPSIPTSICTAVTLTVMNSLHPHWLENKQNIQKHLIHSILGLSSSSVSSSCSSSDSSSMVTPCPGLNHFSLVSTSTFSRLGRGDTSWPWRSRRLAGVGADAAASTWSLGSDVPVDQLARAASSISSHCCKMIAWASSRERNIKFLKQSKSALTRLHKLQQPKKKLQECIASNSTSSDKSSVRDWPSNFVKAAAADSKSMAPTDQI